MLVSLLLRILNLKGIISHMYLLPFYAFKKKIKLKKTEPKIKSFVQTIWVMITVMGFGPSLCNRWRYCSAYLPQLLPAAKSNLLTNVRSWRFRGPPTYWGRRTREGRKKKNWKPNRER